jgi:tRNA (mo5U34)-methyltransferase
MAEGSSLEALVGSTNWYHTLDLPGGIITPGFYDLRPIADRVLPADLSGLRCLDACTASGFWAFEMERRGAAEVVAIDVLSFRDQDWQDPSTAPDEPEFQRRSFDIAHEALSSRVQRRDLSVYDVAPDRIGEFDFVFIGSVLLHLRDPVRALRSLSTVARGELRSLEVVLFWLSLLRPRAARGAFHTGGDARWWTPSAAAHRRWLEAAGFEVDDARKFLYQRFGRLPRLLATGQRRGIRERLGSEVLMTVGVPSQLLVCTAAGS